jgi:hypothetical protein
MADGEIPPSKRRKNASSVRKDPDTVIRISFNPAHPANRAVPYPQNVTQGPRKSHKYGLHRLIQKDLDARKYKTVPEARLAWTALERIHAENAQLPRNREELVVAVSLSHLLGDAY